MTPNFYEYALICNAVYWNGDPRRDASFSKPLSNDWEKLGPSSSMEESGYLGIAYKNKLTNHIVIAHRGTRLQLFFSDIKSDINIACGRIPSAYYDAYIYSKTIREDNPNSTFSETGHSLGGVYAQLNGYLFENTTEIITIDGPGCLNLRKQYAVFRNRKNLEQKFTSYLSAPNLINTVAPHVGNLIRLYIPHISMSGYSQESNQEAYDKSVEIVSLWPTMNGYKLSYQLISIILNGHINYTRRQHSLGNVIQAIHEPTGEPYLQRRIISWPSLNSYLEYWAVNSDIISAIYEDFRLIRQTTHKNLRIEDNIRFIRNYKVGDFIIPAFEFLQNEIANENLLSYKSDYQRSALGNFDKFYSDNLLRENFESQLNRQIPSCIPTETLHKNIRISSSNVPVLWTGGLTGGGLAFTTILFYGSLSAAPLLVGGGAVAGVLAVGTAQLISKYRTQSFEPNQRKQLDNLLSDSERVTTENFQRRIR